MFEALKILLLEDNPSDAEIVVRLLKKVNPQYEFSLAIDKDAFLHALDQFHPDIILSDNNLPQFSASEALEIVQNRSLHIPFILVTGTVSDEFAANIIKSGADDYILKDRLTRLPAAIDTAFKQRRLEKERQEAVEKLIQSEIRYRTIFLKSPLPKWIYDFETLYFLEVNEAAVSHYGYSEQEFLSMTINDIRPEEEREKLLIDLAQIPSEPETRKSSWTHVKKNGERIKVEITAHYIDYNGRKARMVIINDVTERIKADENLRAMQQEILNQKIQEQKKVTRAIIKAQEKERNHIGRELHDNINQMLISTKIYLGVAADESKELNEMVKYPLELIETTIREIRALTSRYVTPLKNINLKDLIQTLLDNLMANSAIHANFVYNVSDHLMEDDLKLNIYRITQEQINNIIKHSGAKNVNVAIEAVQNTVNILIEDDGIGFNIDKKRKGIGISNMINRIESFNGEMELQSSPGNGCRIRIMAKY